MLQNAVVLAGVVAFGFLIRMASQREHWRAAWKQLSASRLAMVSLAVIGCYVVIGLLDSIVWREHSVNEAGRPAMDTSGRPIYEASRSALDRLCNSYLIRRREKTYSSPLATHQYIMETIETPDGKTRRGLPPLRHPGAHLLGTDKIGTDVLYLSLKGVRTALIIGGFSTLLIIPLAILFGVAAGYFGGRVDDAVQYLYTVLASIPSILLIVAFMLITGPGLIWLCIILGITSWTGLCRLLRAETLKIRELEYIQAAQALGMSHLRVMLRHILPNLSHIVVITFVLRFSQLVLTEAILSYLGIGVDPETGSWGRMINAAREELSREPVIWWNLAAAFMFMVGMVLPVNLFGDALRDALDPRLRT